MGKLLITGGAGFIGSTLAKIDIENGWDVRVLDDLSTGLKSNADELINLGIEVVLGDIRNTQLLHSAMGKIQTGFEPIIPTHGPERIGDILSLIHI